MVGNVCQGPFSQLAVRWVGCNGLSPGSVATSAMGRGQAWLVFRAEILGKRIIAPPVNPMALWLSLVKSLPEIEPMSVDVVTLSDGSRCDDPGQIVWIRR